MCIATTHGSFLDLPSSGLPSAEDKPGHLDCRCIVRLSREFHRMDVLDGHVGLLVNAVESGELQLTRLTFSCLDNSAGEWTPPL